MKALTINSYGGPEQLQIEEVPIPFLKAGEVLVRVYAAGINPVDFKIRNGSLKLLTGKKFPRILGGDVAGVIEQCGPKSAFRVGDRVFAMLNLKGGAYAEFVAVKETQLCHIPEGFSMTDAAAVPLAGLTALQSFQKGKGIEPGSKVLINGASGGVGSLGVQIAKALGAEVTAVCSTKNLDFVKKLGADKVVNYLEKDFIQTTDQYDMVFDAVAKSSFLKTKRILSKGGSYVTTIPSPLALLLQSTNALRSKKAFAIMAKPLGSDLQLLAQMMQKQQLKPSIQQVFSLNEGAEAHRLIETERVRGKLVLEVNKE